MLECHVRVENWVLWDVNLEDFGKDDSWIAILMCGSTSVEF